MVCKFVEFIGMFLSLEVQEKKKKLLYNTVMRCNLHNASIKLKSLNNKGLEPWTTTQHYGMIFLNIGNYFKYILWKGKETMKGRSLEKNFLFQNIIK